MSSTWARVVHRFCVHACACICVCVHYNESTPTQRCMRACVYTFNSYVSMCVTFSLLSGRIFTIFLCNYRGNCFFHLLLMLFFADIPFSSILLLFIRVFAKSSFFYVSTHKVRIYFEQTPSKHSVWPWQIFCRIKYNDIEKNISIDAGTRLIRPESMKLLFGYVVIFYIL